MSVLQIVAAAVALAGAAICITGVIALFAATQRRPYNREIAPVKSSPGKGVIWSFTVGMMPWKKESARIHWIAYLRGIILHLGIFIGAVLLIASPWLPAVPGWLLSATGLLLAVAALMGLAGFWVRWHDPVMRSLSTPDDYFALLLVTLFMAAGAAACLSANWLPAFWIISGLTLGYLPFGKLRHSIYFFYSRAFLGLVFGRRGVLE